MIIYHLSYRVLDLDRAIKFFCELFNYEIKDKFPLKMPDGIGRAAVLKYRGNSKNIKLPYYGSAIIDGESFQYHKPPEIFCAEGDYGTSLYTWAKTHNSGLHHIAYLCENVPATMKAWDAAGFAEWGSEIGEYENTKHVFSLPHSVTGMIYELVESPLNSKLLLQIDHNGISYF